MNYTDAIINQYDHEGFRSAFRAYFGELGVTLKNWDGLFAEMTESAEPTVIRQDETGRVIGFIMFAQMDMKSWFFEARCGFIREFWVEEAYRGEGHGGSLLHQAEEWLRRSGAAYALLTTDTAADFYEKRGYHRQAGVRAKNQDDVYVKVL